MSGAYLPFVGKSLAAYQRRAVARIAASLEDTSVRLPLTFARLAR